MLAPMENGEHTDWGCLPRRGRRQSISRRPASPVSQGRVRSQIESDGYSRGGQYISATVRDWSETTTYVLEAEVFRAMIY